MRTIDKQRYTDGPCETIAECVRCGRGFIWVSPDSNGTDSFLPQKGSGAAFAQAPCGGEIVLLAERGEE